MTAASMAKRASGLRHHICVGLQLVVSLCFLSCLLALLRIHAPRHAVPTLFVGHPKVAFLFLARSKLPLDFLWHAFFKTAEEGNFSIYVHSTPGLVLDKSTTRSPFFHGRQIKNSIKVGWGEATMIEAERLLLTAALQDPANQWFVLLSDSCVPLYNFSYVYEYLMHSPKSFVDSFLDTRGGRYNPKMSPIVSKVKWRKGSQWITLIRRHAEVIVADEAVFSVFKKFCKRRPPVAPDADKQLKELIGKKHNCIPDEHYVQTLLSMNNLENELEQRTLTYTSWNQSKNKMEKQSWHPVTFEYPTVSPRHIKEIKDINHIYYETEFRTEWCARNGRSMPCFLFARKFSRGAGIRLLSEGLFGTFDPAKLLLETQ